MVSIYMSEFRHIAENREFARLYMQETAFPRDSDLERNQKSHNVYFGMLFPLLQRAQDRGELRRDIDEYRPHSPPGRSFPSLMRPTRPPIDAPTSTGGRPIWVRIAPRSSTIASVL